MAAAILHTAANLASRSEANHRTLVDSLDKLLKTEIQLQQAGEISTFNTENFDLILHRCFSATVTTAICSLRFALLCVWRWLSVAVCVSLCLTVRLVPCLTVCQSVSVSMPLLCLSPCLTLHLCVPLFTPLSITHCLSYACLHTSLCTSPCLSSHLSL